MTKHCFLSSVSLTPEFPTAYRILVFICALLLHLAAHDGHSGTCALRCADTEDRCLTR